MTSKVLSFTEKRRPPNAGKGRKPGVPNKLTQTVRDAILLAAENTGSDGHGKGGLVGYLEHVAGTDVKAFAGLLGRVLPLQVNGTLNIPVVSQEQRDAAVAAAIRANI